MLIRGVVNYQVDEHPNAALLGSMGELDEIAQGAEGGIDPVVVGNVVAVVLAGRGLEWHQPHRSHPESVQIIEPAHQSREVTDAVAVGVHIGADGKAIDDRILVPEIVDHLRIAAAR